MKLPSAIQTLPLIALLAASGCTLLEPSPTTHGDIASRALLFVVALIPFLSPLMAMGPARQSSGLTEDELLLILGPVCVLQFLLMGALIASRVYTLSYVVMGLSIVLPALTHLGRRGLWAFLLLSTAITVPLLFKFGIPVARHMVPAAVHGTLGALVAIGTAGLAATAWIADLWVSAWAISPVLTVAGPILLALLCLHFRDLYDSLEHLTTFYALVVLAVTAIAIGTPWVVTFLRTWLFVLYGCVLLVLVDLVLRTEILAAIGFMGFLLTLPVAIVGAVWGEEILQFCRRSISLGASALPVALPGWFVALGLASAAVNVVYGLVFSMRDAGARRILAGLAGLALGLTLPVLGSFTFLLGFGSTLALWSEHRRAVGDRWVEESNSLVERGFASMSCGHCHEPIPPRVRRCPHCGVSLRGIWSENQNVWQPPVTTSEETAASYLWLVVAVAVVFGGLGLAISTLVLLILTFVAHRDARDSWATLPLWITQLGLAGLYVFWWRPMLGLAGIFERWVTS